MVKTEIDLQFRVAERLDSKARMYFSFAATVYAVAQALLLQPDVRSGLDSRAGDAKVLGGIATALLLGALATTIWALMPRSEAHLPEDTLRSLLGRAYREDDKAAPDGVNLLIGELQRRKSGNRDRNVRLTWVIWASGGAAAFAFIELALAIQVVV